MNAELEGRLVARFPKFFVGKDKPLTESLMGFGCACGDGWYEIIYETCELLEQLKADIEFVQIKEKFGTLRMYIRYGEEECTDLKRMVVHHIIQTGEEESYYICEMCGSRRKVSLRTPGFWMKVLCDSCYKKREQAHRET